MHDKFKPEYATDIVSEEIMELIADDSTTPYQMAHLIVYLEGFCECMREQTDIQNALKMLRI